MEGTEQVGQSSSEAPAMRPNRGWFQSGDQRINREGRPRGKRASGQDNEAPVELAQRADRLKVLLLPRRDMEHRLSHGDSLWLLNLPADYQIVSCRLDIARDMVSLVLRSGSFPRVAQGSAIPEFVPNFQGLRWLTR